MKKESFQERKLKFNKKTVFLLNKKLVDRLNGGTLTDNPNNPGQSTGKACATLLAGDKNCKSKFENCNNG